MRSWTLREVPEWSGEYDSYKGKQFLDSGKVSEFIGIVPECSRRFRSGAIVEALDGGLRGPKGECPSHLGQAHQPPKAHPASPRGNPKGMF
jgi:hypothetical protein